MGESAGNRRLYPDPLRLFQGLRGKKKNWRRPRTTDSRHAEPVAANIIAERPAPSGPNQAWRTDITYLKTAEGWLFLAAFLDAWSRRVVGWACAPTLHAAWPAPPCRMLSSGAGRQKVCCITRTAAASTSTPITSPCSPPPGWIAA